MSIDLPYGASVSDRRCLSGSESQVSVLGGYCSPRGFSEAHVSILGAEPAAALLRSIPISPICDGYSEGIPRTCKQGCQKAESGMLIKEPSSRSAASALAASDGSTLPMYHLAECSLPV